MPEKDEGDSMGEGHEKQGQRVKRTAKDTVFTSLFREKEYLLQLYQSLHPEDTAAREEDLTIITLENILIRAFMYLAKSYQDYILRTNQDMYGSKKLKLPKPELYVIYTGKRKKRPEYISYAEEFFHEQECCVDIKVKMIYDGKAGDIINQYVSFTKVFDDQVKTYGLTEKTVRETIRICMSRNILKKYLESRESEVVDIMLTLFSQEEVWDMQVRSKQKEAAENAVRPVLLAMKNSAKRMLQEGKLKAGEVAEYFPGLSEADIKEIECEVLEKV